MGWKKASEHQPPKDSLMMIYCRIQKTGEPIQSKVITWNKDHWIFEKGDGMIVEWMDETDTKDWEAAWNKLYKDFKKLSETNENLREENKRYHEEVDRLTDEMLLINKSEWVSIHDNSDGLRAFLDSRNIEYQAREHWTLIKKQFDPYWIGRWCEEWKQKNYPTTPPSL